jgi:putative RNA 2'-phosphotransferase
VDQHLVRLSKEMSRALRHTPWLYELELDPEGWVPVEELIDGIQGRRDHRQKISLADFERIQEQSDKRRFELKDGRIRALYGHSVPARMVKEPGIPPAVLYHGTTPAVLDIIRAGGLKPMRRQYVHLSTDVPTATQVARRKGVPVILEIMAQEAHASGLKFYRGNELVWLADFVPPEYIKNPESK